MFDSHCHLSSLAEHEQLLANAINAGVRWIVNVCTDIASLDRGLLISQKHPWVRLAAATPPHDAIEGAADPLIPQLLPLLENGQLVAIGETGLDLFHSQEHLRAQEQWLRAYIELACRFSLPLILHCRNAFGPLFAILDEYQRTTPLPAGFLIHCFTGTETEAQQVIDRGGLISFSGIVTFKNSHDLQNIARSIDRKNFLIETDAPYLAPVPMRGQTNEPSYLTHTARFLADLRGEPVEEVERYTTLNALRFFRLAGESLGPHRSK